MVNGWKDIMKKTRLGTDVKPSDVIFVPFKINRNEEWGWIKIDSETLC